MQRLEWAGDGDKLHLLKEEAWLDPKDFIRAIGLGENTKKKRENCF